MFAFNVGMQPARLHKERSERASSAAFSPGIYLTHTQERVRCRALSRDPDSIRDVLQQTQWAAKICLQSVFSAPLMLNDGLK